MSKFFYPTLFILLLVLDQSVKFLVTTQNFYYYKNSGFLFGLIGHGPLVLVLIISAFLVMLNLFQYLLSGHPGRGSGIQDSGFQLPGWNDVRIGLALFLSGAVSNLVDRLSRGYVVDYLDWKALLPFWPENFVRYFNLADVFIVVGLVWYLRQTSGRGRNNLQAPF